jgi:hypothetical protein
MSHSLPNGSRIEASASVVSVCVAGSATSAPGRYRRGGLAAYEFGQRQGYGLLEYKR